MLTSQSGASKYFDRGFVTYSNQAKMDMLDVFEQTLDEFGAVSEQVAEQMASGAMRHANADVSVSITGIAGPTGGSIKKPVGTVCFGFCILGKCFTQTQHFLGNRTQIIEASMNFALTTITDKLNG